MIVTILYDWFYPAYKAGGPIQSLVNLTGALGNQIDIQIICRHTDYDDSILGVPTDEWIGFNGSRVYYNTRRFKAIRRIVDNDSVIFINGIYSPIYSLLPIIFLRNRKIVSVRGMLHPGGLESKRFKKRIFFRIWKVLGLHRRCEYHATDELEMSFIKTEFGQEVKVWVVPNLPRIMGYMPLPGKIPGELRLCTVALISPLKNHLLVLKALASCKDAVQYDIYGPVKNTDYWVECMHVIETLPKNIQVRYHGDVHPNQVAKVLAKCHVYIQPSAAENFGHSIYEAMTCGRPVITSFFTPWLNLEERNAGKNVEITGTKAIEDAISYFAARDKIEIEGLGLSARRLALDAMDLENVKKQYLEMFENSK